jgi:hypothetical protein
MGFQPKPGQESWREQRRMGARGTIDLHQIARCKILDSSRVKRGTIFAPDVLCLFYRLAIQLELPFVID